MGSRVPFALLPFGIYIYLSNKVLITLMGIVCSSCHTTKINLWRVVQMGDRGSTGVRPRDRAFGELGFAKIRAAPTFTHVAKRTRCNLKRWQRTR